MCLCAVLRLMQVNIHLEGKYGKGQEERGDLQIIVKVALDDGSHVIHVHSSEKLSTLTCSYVPPQRDTIHSHVLRGGLTDRQYHLYTHTGQNNELFQNLPVAFSSQNNWLTTLTDLKSFCCSCWPIYELLWLTKIFSLLSLAAITECSSGWPKPPCCSHWPK